MFHLPKYREPDFTQTKFTEAPDVSWEKVTIRGVAPENYHSTSMYPEYFKINGTWLLAAESRKASRVVLGEDGKPRVVYHLTLAAGDKVDGVCPEHAADGHYLHLHVSGHAHEDRHGRAL